MMLTVTAEDGTLVTIDEAELKAAKIATQWDSRTRTLFLALTWHDTGIVGDPMIEIDEHGDAIVGIRQPPEEAMSVLEQADAMVEQLVGAGSTELGDLVGAGSSAVER